MTAVVVVGEGQTEEALVNNVLAPSLGARGVFLYARLIPTSKYGRGGALSRDRVVRALRNTLRERSDTFVTTFFDLYGLPGDFPGRAESQGTADPLARAEIVQRELEAAVVAASDCRADRFFAHIQPHEFEALLFSDPDRIAERNAGWRPFAGSLRKAREQAESPEHINDGESTHPSARLEALRPTYQKVLDGPALVETIGLERVRSECHHFGGWLRRLETLQPL